jgi:hypothetical protein
MSTVKKISSGPPTLADATAALKYGTCVKECPKATGKVDCYPPTYMSDKTDYKDC